MPKTNSEPLTTLIHRAALAEAVRRQPALADQPLYLADLKIEVELEILDPLLMYARCTFETEDDDPVEEVLVCLTLEPVGEPKILRENTRVDEEASWDELLRPAVARLGGGAALPGGVLGDLS
jgi:hypothetical protein